MQVPDEVRKTVGFVSYQNKVTKELVTVGSMFFLGHDPIDGGKASSKMYAVTARHVIDGLRKNGCSEVVLRLNMNEGIAPPLGAVIVPVESWFVHPTDATIDVAIFEMGIPDNADHLVIPFSMCATQNKFSEHEVGLGEEVFISGLFRHHFGVKKNVPIVRVGNLAALNEERIVTEKFGEMDAFLIESRSIGGLSGSPVFLNLGITRKIGGQIKQSIGTGPIIYLLGLIHGHFDVKDDIDDPKRSKDSNLAVNESVNAGIAIVVPIESILSVVDAYELKQS